MVWVALVALLTVDSAARRCNMLGFSADVSLHRLQHGRLNPPGAVPFRLFLGQEVEIFCCLRGQTDRNYGFPVSHAPSQVMDNNKHSFGIPIRGGVE